MNLIIETDIGHDPDDLFAISYLIAAGVNVRTILISPGDPDQIAIAKLLCDRVGLKIPIGTSKENRTKLSSGSIHHDLLKKYKYPLEAKADGLGSDILEDVVKNYPDSELFVIGPVSSIGKYIERHPDFQFSRATMQGGFLPYSLHKPAVINPFFEESDWLPTFNLNGDRPASVRFLEANIKDRRLVGKNICHTVLFTKERYHAAGSCNSDAAKLFAEGANLYFTRHDEKKFHDPTAAVLHLHPEIGTWFRGKTTKMKSGWTTEANPEGDHILADIDYEALWNHLLNWK
jgi:inosine-uridine nucleoside N-ribohydrolase